MDRHTLDTHPNVTIVGTGYVGLTTAACLAHLGSNVVCYDVDVAKIEGLERGDVPFVEAGLADLIDKSRGAGRLRFTTSPVDAVSSADVVMLCVPTPQADDGSADLSYVVAAATTLGPALPAGAIVVNKSTVPVGSVRVVTEAIDRPDIAVVSNPEFLREGSAVSDFLAPDRIVIGSDDIDAAHRLSNVYRSLDCPILVTDPATAELIKYAANGFLATKISFANSVAALCEHVGADVELVMRGIGADRRIGPQFLKPGPGWGGSCFPKDSRALVAIAADHGYDFSLMRGVIDINEQQLSRMARKIAIAAGRFEHDRLTGLTIGAWGLTFKAGTDDLRESPSLRVLDMLRRRGATIRAYDPTTCGELAATQRLHLDGYQLVDNPIAAATGSDALAVLTEWPEFCAVPLAEVAAAMRGTAVVDCRNLLSPNAVRAAGLSYEGVGRR